MRKQFRVISKSQKVVVNARPIRNKFAMHNKNYDQGFYGERSLRSFVTEEQTYEYVIG